jgi:hypothetical protein
MPLSHIDFQGADLLRIMELRQIEPALCKTFRVSSRTKRSKDPVSL